MSYLFRKYTKPKNRLYFGAGKIGSFMTGAVARADGAPVSTRVFMGVHGSTFFSREATADSNGHWEIINLEMGRFYWVRIEDIARQLNGAVLDWIQPVPME